jgi:hypothetical protein
MAKDEEKIFEQAKEAAQDCNDKINTKHENAILKIIKEKKLMRFDHIFAHFTGCSRATAYNHNLDKLDSIKEALESNRAKAEDYLLQKWIAGDNATLQIAAMRIIGSPEVRRLLNQQYIEMKQIQDKDMTPEETRDFVISTLKELKKRDE